MNTAITTFILLSQLAGQPAAQLGTYQNLASCQNAIRQIFLLKIAPAARGNTTVLQAIEFDMKYQQTYVCVPNQ